MLVSAVLWIVRPQVPDQDQVKWQALFQFVKFSGWHFQDQYQVKWEDLFQFFLIFFSWSAFPRPRPGQK